MSRGAGHAKDAPESGFHGASIPSPKAKAQSVLRDLGYRDLPVDAFWFMVQDPLVGRSVLIGVVAGIAFFGIEPFAALLSQLPGLGPARPFAEGSLVGLDWFVTRLLDGISGATFNCLALAGLLLTARAVLRRDGLAWMVAALVVFLYVFGESRLSPVLAVSSAAVLSALVLSAVRTGGLLAMLVQLSVGTILWVTPLTFDVGRWYVWRSWFVVALVVGLAVWGFRNVLGKQSAFPAGALDG